MVPLTAFPDLPAQLAADPIMRQLVRLDELRNFTRNVTWRERAIAIVAVLFAVTVGGLMITGMLVRIGWLTPPLK